MTEAFSPSIPDSHRDLLASTALGHGATTGPHGAPQLNPVWFEWTGTHRLFNQSTARQKVRYRGRNPRIAVSIVDPSNPGRYLDAGRVPA